MWIKTTLRFHLTPVRMAKIKNSGDSRCWWGYGERGTLLHCWWGCKLVQLLWKSVWQFLRKMNIVPPENPAISLLSIYPKDAPTYNKDTCPTVFIPVLFIIARSWKEPRCRKPLAPIDGASFPPIIQHAKTFSLMLLGNHISHSPVSGHVIELLEDAPIR